ncbi:deoxyguanosinetriphosphate triphosphohydrolase [Anaeropeptidivorans aminofermentans]|jgi:dGTPase|uniref:deoxyguanosinetriphosphate triphosphohydrolase n=1 Tax=Anaeropeptidivorans aminofermentans TaxID=2934315 RepID=UPI0020252BE3|nr:deoxyguanosinetriphosphate triphosphohydrolase [Anaeropeptidivorans aminofermentans]MBE6012317.1 deoxyguanosinetriphosphate triphosphohydrolase [Lachnospiraceae bacterium]
MNLRELREEYENTHLSEFAAKSSGTKGRAKPQEKCDIRTEFQRDRDRITHSKAFRRLMHKTQVFISPEGDHYRTRLTHTLEVSQIARTISRALNLNEDLTEAIALGHDLGHTPFGHTGEEALDKLWPEGFRHNEQSIRVCEKIEKNGEGLNLTWEVLDGILNHRGCCSPSTLEGKVVQLSDKIGYINHDIDDAIRAGQLREEDLPEESVKILGKGSSERINYLIRNIIRESTGKNDIIISPEARKAMYGLRDYMFETVYTSQLQMKERRKIARILNELYNYFKEDENRLTEEFKNIIVKGETLERAALDYVACMTDRYAIKQYTNIFMPSSWNVY